MKLSVSNSGRSICFLKGFGSILLCSFALAMKLKRSCVHVHVHPDCEYCLSKLHLLHNYLWTHLDADADPDLTFNFDADPDPTFHFDADPDPTFHFHADPDLTFNFDTTRSLFSLADPNQDPNIQFDGDADPYPNFSR